MTRKLIACDDERNIVRLLQVNFERLGYEVIPAQDGIECLEKVASERPDLIVLDVLMPRMDGYAVLKTLQSDPSTASIPVVMLSALAQDEDILRGWRSGVEYYSTKPFSPRELIACIERIFAAQDSRPEERYDLACI